MAEHGMQKFDQTIRGLFRLETPACEDAEISHRRKGLGREKDASLGMFLMPSCAAKITAGANPLGGYLLVTMDV